MNLVRVHHGYFEPNGEIKAEEVRHAQDVVETMKAEGIYSHFSIYFPLWLSPAPGTPWLPGYDGKTHPFAALMFNPDFQAKYRGVVAGALAHAEPDHRPEARRRAGRRRA